MVLIITTCMLVALQVIDFTVIVAIASSVYLVSTYIE